MRWVRMGLLGMMFMGLTGTLLAGEVALSDRDTPDMEGLLRWAQSVSKTSGPEITRQRSHWASYLAERYGLESAEAKALDPKWLELIGMYCPQFSPQTRQRLGEYLHRRVTEARHAHSLLTGSQIAWISNALDQLEQPERATEIVRDYFENGGPREELTILDVTLMLKSLHGQSLQIKAVRLEMAEHLLSVNFRNSREVRECPTWVWTLLTRDLAPIITAHQRSLWAQDLRKSFQQTNTLSIQDIVYLAVGYDLLDADGRPLFIAELLERGQQWQGGRIWELPLLLNHLYIYGKEQEPPQVVAAREKLLSQILTLVTDEKTDFMSIENWIWQGVYRSLSGRVAPQKQQAWLRQFRDAFEKRELNAGELAAVYDAMTTLRAEGSREFLAGQLRRQQVWQAGEAAALISLVKRLGGDAEFSALRRDVLGLLAERCFGQPQIVAAVQTEDWNELFRLAGQEISREESIFWAANLWRGYCETPEKLGALKHSDFRFLVNVWNTLGARGLSGCMEIWRKRMDVWKKMAAEGASPPNWGWDGWALALWKTAATPVSRRLETWNASRDRLRREEILIFDRAEAVDLNSLLEALKTESIGPFSVEGLLEELQTYRREAEEWDGPSPRGSMEPPMDESRRRWVRWLIYRGSQESDWERSAVFWGAAMNEAPEEVFEATLESVFCEVTWQEPSQSLERLKSLVEKISRPERRQKMGTRLADLFYCEGQVATALELLEEAILLGAAPDVNLGFRRVQSLISTQRYEDALNQLEQMGNWPGEPGDHARRIYLIGWIHLQQNRPDAAKNAFRQAVENYPDTIFSAKCRKLLDRLSE